VDMVKPPISISWYQAARRPNDGNAQNGLSALTP